MPAVRRHFRADSGRQRDDNLLAVAFVQEREQLEPAFVLPQIDGDRNVGEHAREVRVPHIAIDHQRRDSARHGRLGDERFADAALIAVEEVNAHPDSQVRGHLDGFVSGARARFVRRRCFRNGARSGLRRRFFLVAA